MSTATPKWQPHLLPSNSAPPDRRHSSATLSKPRQSSTSSSPSSSPLTSRRGSAASHSGPLTAASAITTNNARKYSDGSKPAWMTSIQARDGDTSASPSRRSSLSGLFGRRKSEDTSSATSKKQPQVITSKHAVSIKNVLKADPRGARKYPSAPAKVGEGAMNEGLQHYSHLTAQAQEMRHPHSGPPTLRGNSGLMLTRIVSMGEEPDEEDVGRQEKEVATLEQVREHPGRESVGGASLGGEEGERPTSNRESAVSPTSHTDAFGKLSVNDDLDPEQRRHSHHHDSPAIAEETDATGTEKPRRKSLMDVEIKGAEEGERSTRRRERRNSRVKLVFGGYHRDEKGNWTRK